MSTKLFPQFGPSRHSAVLRDISKLALRFPRQLFAYGLIVCLGGCAANWPANGRYNSYQFEPSSSALEYPVALRTFIQQVESEELGKKLELDAPLHVLHAEFPALSREQVGQKVGRVVVLFAITANGTVDTVQVESSSDKDLTELALAAVSKWRFRPIAKKGKPAVVRLRIPFIFAANHRES